jgi:hypothetical protein
MEERISEIRRREECSPQEAQRKGRGKTQREKRNHPSSGEFLNGWHNPSTASQQKALALRSG